MASRTFWYFPLETLKARYTDQLSNVWLPNAFTSVTDGDWRFVRVETPVVSEDITTGNVLDAVTRGVVSLSQMSAMLQRLDEVSSEDVIYLQDFWTPGLEALLYALHLQNKTPRIYAMCHAQSVDEYDFTYPMRHWMRGVELGWSSTLSGLFVGSTIHRDQLKAAGFECPIHVVGLPIDATEVNRQIALSQRQRTVSTVSRLSGMSYGASVPSTERDNRVVYTSRLNNEKNPFFMLEVARVFLRMFPDWQWAVTTSAAKFTSEVPGLLAAMEQLTRETSGRFYGMEGLTKADYYHELSTAKIQFNCALQDYVSWTMLEAELAGCDLVYPDFRSFPECVSPDRLYRPGQIEDALRVLHEAVIRRRAHIAAGTRCDMGRHVSMSIMLRNYTGPEVNVWHQPLSYFTAVDLY